MVERYRWDTIAEINSIEGPSMNKDHRGDIMTPLRPQRVHYGFMDGGQLTLNMNFTRARYEVMKQDFEIDARDYRITLPMMKKLIFTLRFCN